jgi:anti-repressor protein
MASNKPELTPALVGEMIHSSEQFPVPFGYAVKWLGYTRRDNAKRSLVSNFIADLDYTIATVPVTGRGRPSEEISLTVDCFKAMGMMAGTEKGREVRRYFLECERDLKAVQQGQSEAPVVAEVDQPLPAIADGNASLEELAVRYAFGRGRWAKQQCRDWIRAQGVGDDEWVQYSSPGDVRLPRHHLAKLDEQMEWAGGQAELKDFLSKFTAKERAALQQHCTSMAWDEEAGLVVLLARDEQTANLINSDMVLNPMRVWKNFVAFSLPDMYRRAWRLDAA